MSYNVYAIPENVASGSTFVMSEGNQIIKGKKTFLSISAPEITKLDEEVKSLKEIVTYLQEQFKKISNIS